MNVVQQKLLKILSTEIGGFNELVEIDLEKLQLVLSLAKAHTVAGLLANAVIEGKVKIEDKDSEKNARKILLIKLSQLKKQQDVCLLRFESALSEIVKLLQEESIDFVVFKGLAVASFYPNPSSRTMGDIDFYVPQWDYDRALQVIEKKLKVNVKRCDVDKHDTFKYRDICFEMHYQMETFGSEKHQCYFSNLVDRDIKENRLGHFCISNNIQVPMLSPVADLILVFKHMFNHLIGEGVGLRQVTDMAVLIHAYAPTLNIDTLREHLQNIGYLKAFDAMVALVGRYYNVRWEAYRKHLSTKDFHMADLLMSDILKNGNFGRMDYKYRSGWKKRMETTCRFFANCTKYFCLAPWEIICLVPKRVCISLKAH
jgi:hypothetical protein